MKRILTSLFLAFALCTLSGCTALFVYNSYQDGSSESGMFLAYSKGHGDAFAGAFEVSVEDDGAVFDVPDAYMGYPVTTLGGYYGRGLPCPFAAELNLPEAYRAYVEAQACFASYSPEFDEQGDGWETVTVTVHLGAGIAKLNRVYTESYFGIERGEGDAAVSDILYRVAIRFDVDEGNDVFYAEDGILYFRESGACATA